MDELISDAELIELESVVQDALRTGDRSALDLRGFGVTSVVLAAPVGSPLVACKRVPPFVDREAFAAYRRVVLDNVAALTAADRARYSGVYLLAFPGGLREFTVAEQGTELTGMMAGQQPNPLLHYGNHTFGASFDPTVRISFTVEQGRATKMILMQGANRTEGARK